MPVLRLTLLARPGFRWLAAAMVLNSVGMMGEVVVLGWLTLELTNSPFLVGLAMGARSLPLFFVGVPAGVLADRVPRHRLLMATGAGQAATATAIGTLTLLGHVTLTHVLVLTLIAGTMRGIEHAARLGYTHDVVGAAALLNGFAVLGIAMRTGWLVGSLGTGAVIARLGPGAAYVAVGLAFLAGAAALMATAAPPRTPPREPGSIWQGLVGFVETIRGNRSVVLLMILTAGAEVLGFSHQAVLPSLARDVLGAGPEGLGGLNAARSIGGILGLVATSVHPRLGGEGPLFLAVLLGFGVSLAGLGAAPYVVGFAGVFVVLVIVNAVGALADLLAQSLLQLSVPEGLRGRAGGAWVVAIGLAPLGQLQIGALASLIGVSLALGASGVGLVLLAGATALLSRRVAPAPPTTAPG